MHLRPANWLFLPNAFECMKPLWPFIKISDWPFLPKTVNLVKCFEIPRNSWKGVKFPGILESFPRCGNPGFYLITCPAESLLCNVYDSMMNLQYGVVDWCFTFLQLFSSIWVHHGPSPLDLPLGCHISYGILLQDYMTINMIISNLVIWFRTKLRNVPWQANDQNNRISHCNFVFFFFNKGHVSQPATPSYMFVLDPLKIEIHYHMIAGMLMQFRSIYLPVIMCNIALGRPWLFEMETSL